MYNLVFLPDFRKPNVKITFASSLDESQAIDKARLEEDSAVSFAEVRVYQVRNKRSYLLYSFPCGRERFNRLIQTPYYTARKKA